ncbi:MAG: hypothetical protein HY301_00095 [Verrucomicrobia bacterium]|nr:hypothetical protein [Verrucomicrobiota bacterium]
MKTINEVRLRKPSTHASTHAKRLAMTLLLVAFSFAAPGRGRALAAEPPTVQLFDTGTSSPAPLSSGAITKRTGWKLLPEDETKHVFKDDVVFSNGRLAIALRRKGRGAEVYAVNPNGYTMRTELVAVAGAPSAQLASVKIVENDPGTVKLDATFKTDKGEALTIGYELKLGQVFVQTEPRAGATGLRVVAPCRFAVLPDFFADDIVVDANELAVSETELPSDNFLMHMLGDGDAVVMAIWHPAKDDVRITLSDREKSKVIAHSEIHYAKGGKVCVAVLDSPGIWHRRDIARDEADKIIHLDWKAPFTAHWRVDWRRDDQLNDSWEMLTQKPDGEYVKHGWYGQSESFGNVDWLKDGRKRWTTVLGSFQYPCWADKNGGGFLQPLKKGVRFEGPAIIYPINRLEGTPLEAFTVVDIMRATLGVGPCEYILDVEGQKKTYQGRPTCASRTILNDIYGQKSQKEKRDEVQRTLDEVIAFVRHIRGRIGDYVTFAHTMVVYLEEQKKARPEMSGTLTELEDIVRKMDANVARRQDGIKTAEYATKLVEDFRANLVDYQGDDALTKCKQTTAALVSIGGNQDELVGECRLVVKTLRQRAAMAMAADPRMAQVATEVRRRTQEMLRNPTSYEAPRH